MVLKKKKEEEVSRQKSQVVGQIAYCPHFWACKGVEGW